MRLPSARRRSHRLLDGPTGLDPVADALRAKPQFSLPFSDSHRPALKLNWDAIAPIRCLLLGRGPSAILRCVIAVVVASVQRVTGAWFRPHVSEEGGKRRLPLWAHHDSASAVVMPVLVLLAVAAFFGVPPRPMFSRPAPSMSEPWFALSAPASTALRVSRAKVLAASHEPSAAVTNALPEHGIVPAMFRLFDSTQHRDSLISVAGSVNNMHPMDYMRTDM